MSPAELSSSLSKEQSYQEADVTWPPKIGSPQWRYQYESLRVAEQFLKNKLSDDCSYVADPMARADDSAVLQYIENNLNIFKLDEELLTNPSTERRAEINAQRAGFAATQHETFAFLQRIGQQQNARFEHAKKIYAASRATSHVTGTLGTDGVKAATGEAAQHPTWNDTLLRKLFPRSDAKRAFARAILETRKTQKDQREELCHWIDETLNVDLPAGWMTGSNERSFEAAYKDENKRTAIDKVLAKVLHKLKQEKLL
jgi:hypothetical protein